MGTATEPRHANPLRELVKHTFVYGSGYVTMAMASFALVPIYTRHLSPSEYGLLGLMLVLYGLMSQFYDFGFTNSIGRFFFDSAGEERDTALLHMRATSLSFLLALGGALTLLLWLPAAEWSRLLTQSSHHANLVRIVSVTLYAEGVAIVPLTLIRMQERSRLFVTITLVRFAATLVLSIVFVVSLHWGVRGALLANAATAVGVLLFLLPDCLLGLRTRPSWPLLRRMLAFGLPYFPVILSSWFIEASDRYLLGVFRSHAEVGYYVLGYKVAQVMQISVAAFSMGWAPLRYKIYERSDAAQVYRQLTTYYVLASGVMTVALAVFAREIVSVISPPSYAPAAKIVPLIAFAYALSGLYLLMTTGMGVAKKTTPLAWIVAIAAVVNVGINVVLIPSWGMQIAAVTTVLANLLMVVGVWRYSEKVYPIPYDWSRIIKTTLLGTAVVLISVYAAPGRGIAGIAAATLAWTVFVVALIKSGVIRSHDLARGRQLVARAWQNVARRQAGQGVAS
jgi:O-antigen/teichoic acid export membrane protein